MQEQWRDIEGYENKYQVSNLGRVKSLNYNRTNREKILKLYKNRYGYLYVILYKNGKAKTYTVHRLVVITFMGTPIDEDYCQINHIDEDKTNNKLENLQYCTIKYNCNYGTRNEKRRKVLTNYYKFSKPVIGINIINGYIVEFPSINEAERVMHVSHSHISECCKGKLKTTGNYKWFYANQEEENKNV